ncbi:MAG: FliA/WhiG family RNA polymerase sigma factor, partial [bacterium]
GRAAVHLPPHVETGDLEGVAILGLLRALDHFDPTQNTRFETYATYRVRGAILDYLRKQDVLPRPLRRKAIELEEVSEQLRQTHHRAPTVDELATATGVSLEEMQELQWRATTGYMVSLDQEVAAADEEGARTLQDTLTNALDLGPWERVEQAELLDLLTAAIAALPDRQRYVLSLYYLEEMTLKEIGAILDVSESRVCQIRGEAVFNLRQQLLVDKELGQAPKRAPQPPPVRGR